MLGCWRAARSVVRVLAIADGISMKTACLCALALCLIVPFASTSAAPAADKPVASKYDPQALFAPLHAEYPVNRYRNADGPQSLVLRQVANGVAVRMAVLEALLG